MRVGGQATSVRKFLTIIFQLPRTESTLQEGPSIDSRCRMRLRQQHVSGATVVTWSRTLEEMIKAYFQHGGAGGVRSNMPSHTDAFVLRPEYHGNGIPAQQLFDFFF